MVVVAHCKCHQVSADFITQFVSFSLFLRLLTCAPLLTFKVSSAFGVIVRVSKALSAPRGDREVTATGSICIYKYIFAVNSWPLAMRCCIGVGDWVNWMESMESLKVQPQQPQHRRRRIWISFEYISCRRNRREQRKTAIKLWWWWGRKSNQSIWIGNSEHTRLFPRKLSAKMCVCRCLLTWATNRASSTLTRLNSTLLLLCSVAITATNCWQSSSARWLL